MLKKIPSISEAIVDSKGKFPIMLIPSPGKGKRIKLHSDMLHYEIIDA